MEKMRKVMVCNNIYQQYNIPFVTNVTNATNTARYSYRGRW